MDKVWILVDKVSDLVDKVARLVDKIKTLLDIKNFVVRYGKLVDIKSLKIAIC